MQRMKEPDLRQGETWEAFRGRRMSDRDALELALFKAQPWEKEEIKSELSQVWYDLECARAEIGEFASEVLW